MAHVFVGVDDDAQVHAVDSDGLVVYADLALKITRLQVSARDGYASSERFNQSRTSAFCVTVFSMLTLTSGSFTPATLNR